MSRYKEMVKMVGGLAYLTQLGLSIALPIVGSMWLAGWLVAECGFAGWIIIPALVLGIGSGLCTLISFAKIVEKNNNNSK